MIYFFPLKVTSELARTTKIGKTQDDEFKITNALCGTVPNWFYVFEERLTSE